MTSTEHVTVNVNSGGNRIYSILATLAFIGAVGLLAYTLAQNGQLDIAATALAVFFMNFTRLLFSNGLLRLPEADEEREFAQTASFLRVFARDFAAWQARSPMWRLALLAAGTTVIYLIFRWAISVMLLMFNSPYVILAGCLILGAVVVAPNEIAHVVRSMRTHVRKDA